MNKIIRVVEFICKEAPEFAVDRKTLEDVIAKHDEYGTLLILRNQAREIIAVARWNYLDAKTAHVLECVVKKEYRHPAIIKHLLVTAQSHRPELEYIVFERERKYPYGSKKIYRINRVTKKEKSNG